MPRSRPRLYGEGDNTPSLKSTQNGINVRNRPPVDPSRRSGNVNNHSLFQALMQYRPQAKPPARELHPGRQAWAFPGSSSEQNVDTLAQSTGGRKAFGGTFGRTPATGGSVLDSYVPVDQGPEQFQYGDAPNMDDYIAKAQALFASTGAGNGIANRQAALEANRKSSLGSMSAATQALIAELQKSRGEVDARYTQGINEGAAATSAAQQAVQGAHDTDLAQNAELYRNLGLQVDESRNSNDRAYGVGTIGELGQARDTEQRANQLSRFGLNTGNMDAARMRGVENQGALERGFQDKLAALLDEQQNQQQDVIKTGMGLYGDAQSQYNNDRNFAYQDWVRQQDWARQDAQSQIQAENDMAIAGMKNQPKPSPQDDILQQLMGYGVSQGKAAQWLGRATDHIGDIRADPNNFAKYFSQASPSAKAALYNYLLQTGALKG